jgi:hypothetical protein
MYACPGGAQLCEAHACLCAARLAGMRMFTVCCPCCAVVRRDCTVIACTTWFTTFNRRALLSAISRETSTLPARSGPVIWWHSVTVRPAVHQLMKLSFMRLGARVDQGFTHPTCCNCTGTATVRLQCTETEGSRAERHHTAGCRSVQTPYAFLHTPHHCLSSATAAAQGTHGSTRSV